MQQIKVSIEKDRTVIFKDWGLYQRVVIRKRKKSFWQALRRFFSC